MSRGIITGYRVHVVDHNVSRKLEFNATTNRPSFLRLRELWFVGEYVNLAVEGRSSVGYNDSLHLSVIHIHQLVHGLCSSFQTYHKKTTDFTFGRYIHRVHLNKLESWGYPTVKTA